MTALSLTVNGEAVAADVEPRTHLADFLRGRLLLTGTHLGCEQGVCGACTVLIDGVPQRSCIAYAVDCAGASVTTIEGFDEDPVMAELRQAFTSHHALQCGFCTPGMLATARDIVLRLGDVPEARIRHELAGNICRCTGYVGIVAAIRSVCAGRAPAPLKSASALTVSPKAAVAARAVARPAAAARPLTPSSTSLSSTANLAGGTQIEERIAVDAPADEVWAVLSDLPRVAACLPGAELDHIDGDQVTGRLRVSLGPIRASFAGKARVEMDAAARTGRIAGRGRDSGGSSAEGSARWQVEADGSGSVIVVRLSWRLTGALAQFNRAGLVQDVVRLVASSFAANLEATLRGEAPAAAKPLGLFALLWSLVKARVPLLRRRA